MLNQFDLRELLAEVSIPSVRYTLDYTRKVPLHKNGSYVRINAYFLFTRRIDSFALIEDKLNTLFDQAPFNVNYCMDESINRIQIDFYSLDGLTYDALMEFVLQLKYLYLKSSE
ncbi:hypothetical protein CEW46_26915 [Bacillus cereus]|nr:hypothetical protein CEW46_26915 [Bacillus cereus]